MSGRGGSPLLVLGAGGTLGRALARRAAERDLPHRALRRADLDVTDSAAVGRALDAMRPWAVANAAGWVRVDDAEADPAGCAAVNADAAEVLATACADRGVRLLTVSTDLVFDGRARTPYAESAPVGPLNVYGRTKAEAERRVRGVLPSALVVRTSAFFGPWDDASFAHWVLGRLARGEPAPAADDTVVSPTYVPHLADACLDHLSGGTQGLLHLANAGEVTWAGFAREVAVAAGADPAGVEGVPMSALGLQAPRPRYSALSTERGADLPSLDAALDAFAAATAALV